MEMASDTERNNWKKISKEVKKHPTDCVEQFKQLVSYKKLGKTTTKIVDGFKVTVCPTVYCRGVSPDRNVKSRS